MDGFDQSLKSALGKSNGDIIYTASNGFYKADDDRFLDFNFVVSHSDILQVESFAIVDEQSTGVLLRGIEQDSFSKVTNLNIETLDDGIAIGTQFADKYGLKTGDELVLAFASKKLKHQGAAIINAFPIKKIVEHGIYEKDLRYIYIEKNKLADILDYKVNVSNYGLLKVNDPGSIEKFQRKLQSTLFDDFRFETYWSEFEVLIEAVEMEKFSISMVLQLIVIVAILNVVAFVIFVFEIKSQDIFMLRALGLSFKSFRKFWIYQLLFIWLVSCLSALGLIYIFEDFILTIPSLQVPGDIYVLDKLEVILNLEDYLYVFGISLMWILLIGFVTIQKLKRNTIVSGLRQEFS